MNQQDLCIPMSPDWLSSSLRSQFCVCYPLADVPHPTARGFNLGRSVAKTRSIVASKGMLSGGVFQT